MNFDSSKTRQTIIVPVERGGDVYVVKVHKSLWNEFQINFIQGAEQRRLVVEFEVKDKGGKE